MPPEDRIRLLHMVEAAGQAIGFAKGRRRADMDEDRQFQFALIHAVQIVLEAASKVTKPTKASIAGVPWNIMSGMRNRVIHVYFDTDLDTVWDAVRDDLPPLITTLDRVLGEG